MAIANIPALAAAVVSIAVAAGTIAVSKRTIPVVLFVLLLFCSGVEMLAGAFATSPGWLNLKVALGALLPGMALALCLTYSRGNYRDFLRRWKLVLLAAFLIPLLLVALSGGELVAASPLAPEAGSTFVLLGEPGRGIYLSFTLFAVLALMNLERTFRASVGTLRWRIKYAVLGLALLLGTRVYTATQAVLYRGFDSVAVAIEATAVLVACACISFSFIRAKAVEIELYPSPAVLRQSVTVVLAGIYLLVVGLMAQVASLLGGDAALPLKALVLLLGVLGLGILLLSDRLRQRIQLFVSRHFRRPHYDYRKVWSAFTQQTSLTIDEVAYCRAVGKLLADTFNLLTVNIWLVDPQRDEVRFAASTGLSDDQARVAVANSRNLKPLLALLREKACPVDVDQPGHAWVALTRELHPDFFNKGGNRMVLPLMAAGELLGFVTISDRVSGLRFSTEDMDLLKCLGDHVAAGLRSIRLSLQLAQAKELEAFQLMSAFFVHDLKNMASTLSLMLQNMASHFENPAFRQDAQRGLAKSVAHLHQLISRLGELRHQTALNQVKSNVNALVEKVLSDLREVLAVPVVSRLHSLPQVSLDPVQMEKVISNLLLNARDAVGADGRIEVETSRQNGYVILAVADNGCGMTPEFIQSSLFKPFQTTKKNGLGIGMYHCRSIVEAHQGWVDVESTVGRGSTFRVFLPLDS